MKYMASVVYYGFMGEIMENHFPEKSKKLFEKFMMQLHCEYAKRANQMLPELNSKWHEMHPELEGEVMDDISLMKYNRFISNELQVAIDNVNESISKKIGLFGKIFFSNSIPKILLDPKTATTYFEIPGLGTKEDGSYAELALTKVND